MESTTNKQIKAVMKRVKKHKYSEIHIVLNECVQLECFNFDEMLMKMVKHYMDAGLTHMNGGVVYMIIAHEKKNWVIKLSISIEETHREAGMSITMKSDKKKIIILLQNLTATHRFITDESNNSLFLH